MTCTDIAQTRINTGPEDGGPHLTTGRLAPDVTSARDCSNDADRSPISGSNSGQNANIPPSNVEGIATDFLAVKPSVAVLFARADSIYKTIPECDVYDIDRDARNYAGPMPIVAHPPCRAWGVFAMFAKPRDDEKALAVWSVDQIRKWGGGSRASIRVEALARIEFTRGRISG